MDDLLQDAPQVDSWREALAQSIEHARRRAGKKTSEHRDRLRDLDARIASQLDAAIATLSSEQEQAQQLSAHTQTKAATLEERQKLLDKRQKQLDARQEELDKLQADLAQEKASAALAHIDFKQHEAELAAQRQTLAGESASHAAQRDALRELENTLRLKEQALAAREEQTRRQRQSASRQLRAKKKTLATGAANNQLTQHAAELDQVRRQSAEQIEALRADFIQARENEARSLRQQLDALQARLTEAEAAAREQQSAAREYQTAAKQAEATVREAENAARQAEAATRQAENTAREAQAALREAQAAAHQAEAAARDAQNDLRRAEKQLAEQPAGDPQADRAVQTLTAEVEKLREENKQLETWLAEAEQRANSAGQASDGNPELEDLRRRFEMAIQDVRELKTKNVELTEQLAKTPSLGIPSAAAVAGGSWESMKQKLLADMENSFDEGDAFQKADKLTVQGAIKITDEIVAEKDRELDELRRLLDCQAQQVGEVAVGAAAVAQMLDTDELVRQEREALKRLQDQLRDQLRQAELDCSVERARLARERSEMEDQLRAFESEKENLVAAAGTGGDPSKKPSRRKWLARLGLGEGGEG